MKQIFSKLTGFFHAGKGRSFSRYEEIFSTTENKVNTQNTDPLKVADETFSPNSLRVKSFLEDDFCSETRNSEFLLDEAFDAYPEYSAENPVESAKTIKNKLKKEIKGLNIKFCVMFAIFVLSLAADSVLFNFLNSLSAPIDVNYSAVYLITSNVLLILGCIIGFSFIKSAFNHISYFVFAADTAIFLPLIITFLHCYACLLFHLRHSAHSAFCPHTYVSLLLFNFLLVILNSLTAKKRMLSNFKFVAASKQKYNIDMYSLGDVVPSVTSRTPVLTPYTHKTNFLTNFIKNSCCESFTESMVAKIIPTSLIFACVCGIVSLVGTTFHHFSNMSIIGALACFDVVLLLCTPFALPFTVNFVVSSLCRRALKFRAMVVGENAIKKVSKTKSIVLNDADLYPPNNIVLRGIKTFNGQRVDEAILAAASVICRLNAPISQVFDKIIMGKRAILTKVSDITYRENKGIIGWVNGKRILVGNRELLKDFKIDPPSRDYEKKYRVPGCELTYFAIGQNLVAMFVLEYTPSKSLSGALLACARSNIKIFVKTVDCNLTLSKIASDFSVNEKFLTLLSYDDSQKINTLCDKVEDSSNAFAATFGSCASFVKLVLACCFAKSNIALVTTIQVLQLIFNVFLVCTLNFDISKISIFALILYSALWFVFSVLAARMRNFK